MARNPNGGYTVAGDSYNLSDSTLTHFMVTIKIKKPQPFAQKDGVLYI
jgi:hypothetical protein